VIRVWDSFVRIFHWTLAASFVVAWFSAQRWEDLHDGAGCLAVALVLLRLLWGFAGSRYARFSQFVRSPRAIFDYLRSILSGGERRFIGNNPAGGAMILALLVGMVIVVFTVWMMATDAYWGMTWVQRLHSALAHGFIILVVLHIAGVALSNVRHRENLVRAMFAGTKSAAAANDVG
jgi:cytochrome b